MALQHRFRSRYATDVDVIWSDDGIAFRFPDSDEPPEADDLILDPEEVEGLLIDHLSDTALFAARFREAAGRALLLPRRRPGERTPLWLQRRRSADLLGVARQFGSFPILLEVYREILRDDFDLPSLQEVLGDIRSRKIRVASIDTQGPSPFASSLLFSFVAAYLYEADAPLAERRATALTLDRELLRELLGEGELRELIDPEVVAAVELELQHLTDKRRATSIDRLHDMLRDLGPLTTQDIEVRSESIDVVSALALLGEQRRVIQVVISGDDRWAAIEDAGRLRDGLGVQPPPGGLIVDAASAVGGKLKSIGKMIYTSDFADLDATQYRVTTGRKVEKVVRIERVARRLSISQAEQARHCRASRVIRLQILPPLSS